MYEVSHIPPPAVAWWAKHWVESTTIIASGLIPGPVVGLTLMLDWLNGGFLSPDLRMWMIIVSGIIAVYLVAMILRVRSVQRNTLPHLIVSSVYWLLSLLGVACEGFILVVGLQAAF